MSSRIRIGRARQVEHFLAIEDLQKEVWEFSDREIIPRNELITIQRNGGVVLCAWDGPEMVGFVFGFVGLDGRRLQHASRMLAVRASHRVHGIGRRLKAAQRRAVLRPMHLFQEILADPGGQRVTVSLSRLDSTSAETPSTPETGGDTLLGARELRELDERRRRAGEAIPPLLVLDTALTLRPRQVLLVTYDGQARRLVARTEDR